MQQGCSDVHLAVGVPPMLPPDVVLVPVILAFPMTMS
jgi:hypothetical protein